MVVFFVVILVEIALKLLEIVVILVEIALKLLEIASLYIFMQSRGVGTTG